MCVVALDVDVLTTGLCVSHTHKCMHAGYGRVVVDPLVRLAYDARTDLDLQARHDL